MTDYTKIADVLLALGASQDADTDNRDKARESHLFIDKTDGQWEPYMWNTNSGKPRYSFDMTSPIVDQISGEMEQADFAVTVRPSGGEATKDSAKVFDGLVRNIQNISSATDIYQLAARGMVTCGLDGWQIKQKYIDDDSFDQDLVIEPIANYIDSVWFGPFKKPDASDAPWCIVLEALPREEYDEKFPDGSSQSVSDDKTSEAYYDKADQIIIGQLYYIEEEERELLLMSSGRVIENTPEVMTVIDDMAASGEMVVDRRMRPKNIVKSRLFDGRDWLKPAQTTVFNQIPVIPCIANFKIFENKLLYRGVVEKLLDPQRVFNYAKSREIEEGALAPRAKYWMTDKQTAGHEDTLATMNTNADPVQTYNHDSEVPGAPQQNGGAQVNPGLQAISADMNGVIRQTAGLFAANMGDNPGLQSGVALKRLQDKGDIGTIKYFKAMERAISRTGRILVDAIPVVYDTQRQVRILKEDGSYDMTVLNQPVQDQQTGRMVTVNDVSAGTYDVTCSSGPSFQNRQEETVTAIIEMGQVDPSIIEMGGDILFSNINSPGMDMIAERKRQQIYNAGMIPMEQQTDEEKQQTEQMQQQPPPPDPMMIAAEAEASKAQAQTDKVMVDMQIAQSKEQRENFKAQGDAQQQQVDNQFTAQGQQLSAQGQQMDASGKMMSTHANMQTNQQKHELDVFTAQQDARDNQFNQMMTMQMNMVDALNTQAGTLKLLREAMGVDTVVSSESASAFAEQAEMITDTQETIDNCKER